MDRGYRILCLCRTVLRVGVVFPFKGCLFFVLFFFFVIPFDVLIFSNLCVSCSTKMSFKPYNSADDSNALIGFAVYLPYYLHMLL